MSTHPIGKVLLEDGKGRQDMRLGVTGHQIMDVSVETWVTNMMHEIVIDRRPEAGLTCLAMGTDQIFAGILLALKIPFIVVIPSLDYEQTFQEFASLSRYKHLLTKAESEIRLDVQHASEKAYFQAGKILVDKSDMLVAVWDGRPAKGLGGTADVVNYALQRKKRIIHVNISTRVVSEI